MPNLKYSGRLLMTAALAASTTLTGPTFALAEQRNAIRLAQADDALVAPQAEPSDAAPAEEAPARPRRQRQEAEPSSGETGGGEAGETRRPRGEARQGSAEDGSGEEAQPRRPRRQAQPEGDAGESASPAQPPAEDKAPTRRERRQQPSGENAGDAASPPAAEDAETPRREQRRNRQEAQPTGEEQATPPPSADEGTKPRSQRRQNAGSGEEAPAAAGSASEPESQEAKPRPPQRRQPAEPSASTPPAEPTPDGAAASPGSAPAGTTTRATPDTSAPAATAAPAPAGEVPATPGAAAPPPPAPNAATPPGAPDASPAVPNGTDAARPAVPGVTPGAAGAAPGVDNGQPARNVPVPPAAPEQAAPGAPVPPAPGAPAPPTPGSGAGAPATAAPPPPPAASLRPQAVPADVQNAPIQPGRIDQSDARVQTLQQPVVVQPITQERGERLREAPRYDLPPDSNVVKRDGDRQILSLGAAAVAGAVAGAAAGYFIRSNDDERLGVDSRDRYTERLPRGRTRETIVRDNGVQVVTITNRYGDVVQRSRVMPDGREVVLFYDPYSEEGQRRDYFDDPGRDLPPIRVDIPDDEYVVDVDQPDEELYYDTLVAPPVETVERIYSVEEVRRSPRIREKVRRIDLATINFDFASANIAQNQVGKLQDLAEAIQKIVKDNPGETFLIEGHTDAVGSPEANLVLSDKRAESVASALSQYFEVPSENLVTQGYGEQELKVKTESESRENRRVTVRRITALVKPVATSSR